MRMPTPALNVEVHMTKNLSARLKLRQRRVMVTLFVVHMTKNLSARLKHDCCPVRKT